MVRPRPQEQDSLPSPPLPCFSATKHHKLAVHGTELQSTRDIDEEALLPCRAAAAQDREGPR
jgi:hypothetical protein